MFVYSKSLWKEDNIADKLRKGTDGIEIQLKGEDDPFFLEDWWDMISDESKNGIVAIHTPLVTRVEGLKKFHDACNIETVASQEIIRTMLPKAEKLSDFNGRRITLILHTEMENQRLKETGLYDGTVRFLKQIAEEHSTLAFAIENTTKLYSQPFSCVDLVKDVNLPNVGTCIDTCHAMIVTDTTRRLRGTGCKFVPFECTFDRMGDTAIWMHLSNCKDFGEGYGVGHGHGCPFDMDNAEDRRWLEHILWLYKTHLSCPICIEVQEEDYTNSENYQKTKEALYEVCRYMNVR